MNGEQAAVVRPCQRCGASVATGRLCDKCREYHREYERRYYRDPQNRARRSALRRTKTKPQLVRERHRAHVQVNKAIAAGKLTRQPCEVCGVAEPIHAHHDDYRKPLKVRWLCPMHHRQHHVQNGGDYHE